MTPVDAMLWTLSGVTIVGAVVLLLLPAPEDCHAREEEAVHRHGQVRHVREGPQHERHARPAGGARPSRGELVWIQGQGWHL